MKKIKVMRYCEYHGCIKSAMIIYFVHSLSYLFEITHCNGSVSSSILIYIYSHIYIFKYSFLEIIHTTNVSPLFIYNHNVN